MKKIERNVDASMPPATDVPTELRAPAPAPVATASGSTPRMNANDVMRIGRSRMRAASTAASTIDMPLLAQLLGELDDQDRVLGREADEHDEADLAEDVVGEPAQQLGAQPAEDRERHAQQDDEGQDPALVLRGEHQIDEHQARARRCSIAWVPAFTSSSDCADQAKSNPGGRSRETSSIACSAWPELVPGRRARR